MEPKEFYFNMEPRLKWNKIIVAWIFMRQLLQPITAFVYCNQAPPAAGGRRDGNFQAPVGACASERAVNSAHSLKLFYFISFHDGTTREIK